MKDLHAPMQPSKLQNYNSPRGASAKSDKLATVGKA